MCGIVGEFYFDPRHRVAPARLQAMLETLRHRGPDDDGLLCEENVGIGMRRLSVIDLSGGHQPLGNEDDSLQIVFNGEIYNYLELRAELLAAGHTFRTASDTETIIHGYEEWGAGVLPKLNGMFAFALWDRRERTVLLARDRLGIKPLFVAALPERVVFASELKALLAAGVPAEIDPWAINQYFAHWYVPTPRTIYRGLTKLEPGSSLTLTPAGTKQSLYWAMSYQPEAPARPIEDWDEELRDALAQAVSHQMRSDVEVGAFLSGGLDSSLVTSFMAPLTGHRLKTYTIGFTEGSYGEQEVARRIAEQIGTDHHTEMMGAESLDLLPLLAAHFDEPFGDYSMLPTYVVSRLARQTVKVVLTGDGGDEMFGGYPTHFVWRWAKRWRMLPRPVRRLLAKGVERLPVSMDRISLDYALRRFVRGAELDYRRGHYAWKEILSEAERAALLAPELWRQVAGDEPFGAFARYFDEVADQPILNQLLYVDLKTFLLDDCLVKVDRMSMAASLEVRVPLLDNTVLDLAGRLPVAYKLPGRKTKNMLRRLAYRQLPPGVSGLRKKGFTPPLPLWLQGPGRELLHDVLSPTTIAGMGYFKPEMVARMIAEHVAGSRDWNRPLFGLLAFALWHDRRSAAMLPPVT